MTISEQPPIKSLTAKAVDPATPLFATLTEAKKAGWIVRTRNEGPSDWVHYSATIYRADDPNFCEFLVSRDAMWERTDAKRHALEWINDHVANVQAQTQQGQARRSRAATY